MARGPLQLYFGDTADPDNTTMIGAQFSDDPSKWIQVQALGVTPGVPMQVVATEKQARWANLWAKSTLVYQATPSGFRKYIHLREGHPAVFRFAVRIPAGGSIVPANGGAEVRDDQGRVYLRIPAPWGTDAEDTAIRVAMEWGAAYTEPSGCHVQVFRFVTNQDDLDGAVYPVVVDPTVQITGTTNVEDNMLYKAVGSYNYGGAVFAIFGQRLANQTYRMVMRINETEIPAGTITDFRLKIWRYPNSHSINSGNLTFYIIKDANDWVEGTLPGGSSQTGSSCWTHAKYSAQTWAGAAGCGTSGTDYDADGSPPTHPYAAYTSGPDVLHTVDLDAAWPPLWRDAVRLNNGIVGFGREDIFDTQFSARSTESGSNPLYFEVDYTPAGGRSHSMARGIGRGIGRGLG